MIAGPDVIIKKRENNWATVVKLGILRNLKLKLLFDYFKKQ
jgi:hypothetical protein